MTPFTEDVIEIIKSIPPGKVMTYGQVAEWAGNPRGARQVVRILHSKSRSHDLPWHRVINSKGEISLPADKGGLLQRHLLEEEGVEFTGSGKVDLRIYRYTGI
ncbi:methylated-DNA-protein-cysteine methyltransferase related protein [Dethiosulfatibacter aminovorans DSM 17477]|uniref:Methylated-DNA-protein-cysteine methyltransferase related protein n=1 Tax=Dethiosulfatibacter aminovorans DSM 17477 TaxID=1121476 RepID=A0A1M6KML1_9FIRM|nr:MGMT family protein [Dethiosulfatibacter aminovorans]SHJ60122.1 methylated-DNA-protein-cysteine methyltransferase related protein [Dethiosulfatibacter aminovorans DSM 17477]